MKLLLLIATIFIASCSATPYRMRSASLDDYDDEGLAFSRVSAGKYQVAILYNNRTDDITAEDYLKIKGFELCRSEGFNYFNMTFKTKAPLYKLKSMTIHASCTNNDMVKGLGVIFDTNTKIITSLKPSADKNLKVGDKISHIFGKEFIPEYYRQEMHNSRNGYADLILVRNGKSLKKRVQLVDDLKAIGKAEVLEMMARSKVEASKLAPKTL